MEYPDGRTIRAGDLSWWNGGSCVGYVQSVPDREEEYGSWGFGGPHLMLSNAHPFDSRETSGIAYPQDCLAEEGIRLLSPQEFTDLVAAIAAARIEDIPFGVFADIHNNIMTHWKFEIRNPATARQIIRVPIGTAMATERATRRAFDGPR